MAHYLGEEAELWIDASHETTNPSGCLEPAPRYIHLARRERRRRTDTLFEEVDGDGSIAQRYRERDRSLLGWTMIASHRVPVTRRKHN